MARIDNIRESLVATPKKWVVTGAAGFIGSALVEELLRLGQTVTGLDNFETGHQRNIDEAIAAAGNHAEKFNLVEGDIIDAQTCAAVMTDVDYVLHQAALGSVPRSMEEPHNTHASNATGFVNVAIAAKDAGASRVVYASSSAVYGDAPGLPKREADIGTPLSPYAASKLVDEVYAASFASAYKQEIVGLRYFNVFGRRQDPAGAYAAVIPKWIDLLLGGSDCAVFGDGSQTRDFCYVDNVVEANLLAATVGDASAAPVYNVGCGKTTTLLGLFELLRAECKRFVPQAADSKCITSQPRAGDIEHSQASIDRLRDALGFAITHSVEAGLAATVKWYAESRGLHPTR